ncbi:prefoldin subunit alpha [Candidatus Marsarchaeota archaeon]|jgi:prefoldin alpha subunit|nr:prefoldin subunit alpha [Candidatus Marsarchaeota archaeon]
MSAQESGESLEEAVQNLQYMQQVYQNQYATISREINAVMDYINELNAAKASMEKFDKIKDSKILSPIGSSVFINAKAASEPNVLVGIGGGYLIEKEIANAIEYLSSRIEMHTKSMQELLKARNKAEEAMFEISTRLDKILKRA